MSDNKPTRNALKTDLTKLLHYHSGRLVISIGGGSFRTELSSIIQQTLMMGAARQELRDFEFFEEALKKRGGKKEIAEYIERRRRQIAAQYDWEF